MDSIQRRDSITELSDNLKAAKDDIREEFRGLKKMLVQKENIIMDQLDEVFHQNVASIKELIKLRTETQSSKENISKIVGKSNILHSFSNNLKELDSMLDNVTSQIDSLTTIRYSLEIPENLFDNLVTIEGEEPQMKIDSDVAKGKEIYELSGNLSALKIHNDKIYIADKGANAIKVFTRNGRYIETYSHAMLTSPWGMVILNDYLYVLTNDYTCNKLFKLSTGNLDTVSIVTLKHTFEAIDTDGGSLFLLRALCVKLEKWNKCLFRETKFHLASPHNRTFGLSTSSFHDMMIRKNEIYVLFSSSTYILQSFDFKGNLIRAILQKDFTHNIVGICLLPQENGEIILRDETNSQILVFSYQGQITRIIGTEDTSMGMMSPMCMDVDKRGNLVVCDGKANWMMQDIPLQ